MNIVFLIIKGEKIATFVSNPSPDWLRIQTMLQRPILESLILQKFD